MAICRAVVIAMGLSIALANALVEERYEYDLLGRTTKQSIFDGSTEVESKTDYFVTTANAITTTLPGCGVVIRAVDTPPTLRYNR